MTIKDHPVLRYENQRAGSWGNAQSRAIEFDTADTAFVDNEAVRLMRLRPGMRIIAVSVTVQTAMGSAAAMNVGYAVGEFDVGIAGGRGCRQWAQRLLCEQHRHQCPGSLRRQGECLQCASRRDLRRLPDGAVRGRNHGPPTPMVYSSSTSSSSTSATTDRRAAGRSKAGEVHARPVRREAAL